MKVLLLIAVVTKWVTTLSLLAMVVVEVTGGGEAKGNLLGMVLGAGGSGRERAKEERDHGAAEKGRGKGRDGVGSSY